MTILITLWIFLFTFISSQSHYDPHKPYSNPFFEGWYARLTTLDASPIQSIGIIFGSYPRPPIHLNGSNAILNLFYSFRENGTITSIPLQLDDLDVRQNMCNFSMDSHISRSMDSKSPCFTILFHSHQHINGSIVVSPTKHVYDLSFVVKDTGILYSFYAEMMNHQHWDANDLGPLRELYQSPIKLPQYWYVYSTASDAKFELKVDDVLYSGIGVSHMEKNWGEFFPKSWIWAQYADKETQIVLAGGDTGLSLPSPPIYMMFIKTRINNRIQHFTWSPFDLILPSRLQMKISSTQNEVQVTTNMRHFRISLKFKSHPDKFTGFLCPTPQGFREYSIESFDSNVTMHITDRFGRVSSLYGSGAALEFGGDLVF